MSVERDCRRHGTIRKEKRHMSDKQGRRAQVFKRTARDMDFGRTGRSMRMIGKRKKRQIFDEQSETRE